MDSYSEHRRRSLHSSSFSSPSFTRDLYDKSPQFLKKNENSLNLFGSKGYESPLSSEIYRNWSPEIKNNMMHVPNANLRMPRSFSSSNVQNDIIKKPPVGFWRHPLLDIIFKRIRKAGVMEETIKRLIINVMAIIIIHWSLIYFSKISRDIFKTIYIFVHIILLYNVFEATLRFIRPKDTFLDLSLTPIQRKLFGLDPDGLFISSLPNNSITPPRYTKSSPQSRQSPRLSPQQITPYDEGSQISRSNSETKNSLKPSPLRNELPTPTPTNLSTLPGSASNKDFKDRTQFIPSARYLYKRYSLDSYS
ncbi:hypothetical protein PORY_001140 [Pneumocystis oryctolagi]|uniref:Uncharacterized protein n=1 Tax=Pneumocystis oryctolagi TaxID=42067 RepID=A0ACB7CIJ2_9ASCO|nr:hypothetical protein PORY_001140 [Pneumocystis oryctolagi]